MCCTFSLAALVTNVCVTCRYLAVGAGTQHSPCTQPLMSPLSGDIRTWCTCFPCSSGGQHQRVQWCCWSETVSYVHLQHNILITHIYSVRHMQLPPLDAAQLEEHGKQVHHVLMSPLKGDIKGCVQGLCCVPAPTAKYLQVTHTLVTRAAKLNVQHMSNHVCLLAQLCEKNLLLGLRN